MTDFAVWAPFASTVDLVIDDDRTMALDRSEDGWFLVTRDPGRVRRYAFRLDGTEVHPDPRSRWQPDGVDGSSAVVDLGAFDWHDDAYIPRGLDDAVLYELHVGTFTTAGTYLAALDHLDHLLDLGVTHLELLPVATFAGRHGWGYDGVFPYAPHPAYGTPTELQTFVDRCHAVGIGVVLDVVLNHLGPIGNHLQAFGPYLTDRHATPWGPTFDVDGPHSEVVRDFLLDQIRLWLLDYHVDGIRFDALHAVVDDSSRHLFDDLVAVVDSCAEATGRARLAIAEFDGDRTDLVRPASEGGHGFSAVWNDDIHHVVHTALTGERTGYYRDFDGLRDIARAWTSGLVLDRRAAGERERDGARPRERDGRRSIVSLQNHDQVGNRPDGARIGMTTSWARQAVGAAIVLLSPFVPMIFQGEEWMSSSPFPYFADVTDEDLADAVRRGRAEEFASFGHDPRSFIDPFDPSTFASARLDWSELVRPGHAEMLEWYRTLLRLRRTTPELASHDLDASSACVDTHASVALLHRGRYTLAVNLGTEDARVVPIDRSDTCHVLAASRGPLVTDGDALVLPLDSVAVLGCEQRHPPGTDAAMSTEVVPRVRIAP